jgi:twitching motility protein PilT
MAEPPFTADPTGAALSAAPLSPPPPPPPLAPPPIPSGAAPDSAQSQPAGEGAEASAYPASLEGIVRHAFMRQYSDVHLGVGEEPRFRSRGDIVRSGWPVTDALTFREWMREILDPAGFDRFQQLKDYDGSFAFGFVRIRVNLFQSLLGPAMVLRLIPQQIATLEELELPLALAELLRRPKGLILVTGPTGSGKSTTLAALIDHINRNMKRHVITIEDPVEFLHQSSQSLVRQRQVGLHTNELKTALRACLREDPDVIMIGEIRDKETLEIALQASQAGQLVLGSMHTNSAVRTVERVVGMVSPQDQDSVRRGLSESLLAIISQGLAKTLAGQRVGFFEILINTDACREYIRNSELDPIEEIMARSGFAGMQTADQSLLRLVEAGRISSEEALALSQRPGELGQALRGRF